MRFGLIAMVIVSLSFISAQSMARSGSASAGMKKWERWVESFPQSEDFRVRWRPHHQTLGSLHGPILPPMNERSAEVRVKKLVKRIARLHGIRSGDLVQTEKQGSANRSALRYSQNFKGLPVEDKALLLTVKKDGAVVGIENNLASFSAAATPMVIKAEEARKRALNALKAPLVDQAAQPNPTPVVLEVLGTPVRAWRVPVMMLPTGVYSVYVRGDDGQILWVRNRMIK